MLLSTRQPKSCRSKIVYYGPAMGGKTTILSRYMTTCRPQPATKASSSPSRPVFRPHAVFRLLPIEAMSIKGFKRNFSLYVPGQVIYTPPDNWSFAESMASFVADSAVREK